MMPSPLQIYELLEKILSHLPYHDLRCSRQVNTYWNYLITSSLSIQRQLWKCPETSEDLNAHFNNTWDAINSSTLGRPIFQQKQNALDQVLSGETVSCESWNRYEVVESTFGRIVGNNGDAESETPIQLCGKCYSLHPGFRYANIHPLLRDLEHLLCITGKGSALIANISVIGEPSHPHLITRLFNLAMYLIHLPHRWQKLKNDMFTRPVCTRLVITSGCGCYVLRQRPGITVGGVVMSLIWECHDSLKGLEVGDFDTFLEDLQMWEWQEMNDGRTVHMFFEEMQRLKDCEINSINEHTGFGQLREMEIGEKEFYRKKQALETLRDYFVDKLSDIIALDVLKEVKIDCV